MKPLFVVSDDVTGCTDSGAIFLSAGASVMVVADPETRERPFRGWDVVSSNMSSRTLDGRRARETHEALAQQIAERDRSAVMKKMDIGFRGNAAFEIEGLMRGLGSPVCFLAAHAPWRNTYTEKGCQYYEGIPLERSIVASEDPLKRPARSDIAGILRADTSLAVANVGLEEIRSEDLERCVRELVASGARILVMDAVTKEDGCRIVSSLALSWPNALWAGSGGLAWGMATHFFGEPADTLADLGRARKAPHCVVFCASKYSTTARQIAYAEERCSLKRIALDMERIRDGGEIERVVARCIDANRSGDFILVPEVPASLEGCSPDMPGRILEALSSCARAICAEAAFDRLVVIGGETAQAIFRALGIDGLRLLERPEPGLGGGTIMGGPYDGREVSIKGGVTGSPGALCMMLGKHAD